MLTRLTLLFFLLLPTAPAAIRDIVTRLRAVKGEELDTRVRPDVAADLAALKHALRDLICDVVRAPGSVHNDPRQLQARVIERLGSEDVPVGDIGQFGVITAIELARPNEYPGWLVATVSLEIPWGDDTSVYVFDIRSGHWRLALGVESNGYDEISGAQGWLRYRVGRTSTGVPFVVTTEHSPWPTSVWQNLRLKAFQAGTSPDRPVRLVRRTFEYNIDEESQVVIRPGGFGLVYGGGSPDGPAFYHLEYSVVPGRASILRSDSLIPADFTKAWSEQNWQTAFRSIDPPARAETNEWYRRFRRWQFGCEGYVQLGSRRDQLLVVSQCQPRLGEPEPPGYALFRAGPTGLRFVSITSTAPDWFRIYGPVACKSASPGKTHPIVEHAIEPELPPGFTTGAIRLQVGVADDGTVDSVEVLDWPDRAGLVIPAITAVKQWKFKPATRGGCLEPDHLTVTVTFNPHHLE